MPRKKQAPDWMATPKVRGAEYALVLYSYHAVEGDPQRLGMTRAEFIALKKQLAKLRGYDVKEAA